MGIKSKTFIVSLRVSSLLVVALTLPVLTTSLAWSAGEGWCGRAAGSAGVRPTASDALILARAAVGLSPCPRCLCDVDGDEKVVGTDALRVMRKAVNLPETLTCDPTITDTEGGSTISCTACTQTAIRNVLTSLPNGKRVTEVTSVAFMCDTPVQLTDDIWGQPGALGCPQVTANDVMIQTGAVFELSPKCSERCLSKCTGPNPDLLLNKDCTRNTDCSEGSCSMLAAFQSCTQTGGCPDIGTAIGQFCNTGANPPRCESKCRSATGNPGPLLDRTCHDNASCSAGDTCEGLPNETACSTDNDCPNISAKFPGKRCSQQVCPGIDANATRFLELMGSNITLANMTVRGFFEGVHVAGSNNTIHGVTFDRECDDAVSHVGSGKGNEVHSSTIMSGCDKCVQDEGTASISSLCKLENIVDDNSDRSCYHMSYVNVDFDGCETAVRWVEGGTFLMRDSTVHRTYGLFDPDFVGRIGSGTNDPKTHARLQGNTFRDTSGGLILGGGNPNNLAVMDMNTFEDNNKRGALLIKEAKGIFRRNVFHDNGGATETGNNSFRHYGGVAVSGELVDDPTAELGDVSSGGSTDCNDPTPEGCNSFCLNTGSPNNARNVPATWTGGLMQVHNGRSTMLKAENNYWANDSASAVIGPGMTPGDISPQLSTDPNGSNCP